MHLHKILKALHCFQSHHLTSTTLLGGVQQYLLQSVKIKFKLLLTACTVEEGDFLYTNLIERRQYFFDIFGLYHAPADMQLLLCFDAKLLLGLECQYGLFFVQGRDVVLVEDVILEIAQVGTVSCSVSAYFEEIAMALTTQVQLRYRSLWMIEILHHYTCTAKRETMTSRSISRPSITRENRPASSPRIHNFLIWIAR